MQIEFIRNDEGTPVSGTVIYLDVKFTFSLHRASPRKNYDYVLAASVISPGTGKILQSSAKYKKVKDKLTAKERDKLKKQQSIERLNAQSETYLHENSEKAIKASLEQLIPKLYSDYEVDIAPLLKSASSPENLHLVTIYRLYGKEFFRFLPKISEKRLKEKKMILKKLCSLLNSKEIKSLTAEDIKAAASFITGDKSAKIRLLENFIQFCLENHFFSGSNPATDYLKGTRLKKSGGHGKKQSTHLSEKSEQKLHQLIIESIEDDLSLSIPFVKGFGISLDYLLTMTWGELRINGVDVTVSDHKSTLTGGTHNYTRPPARETTDIILLKHSILRTRYSEQQLNKQLVVPLSGSSAQKKAKLSQYFRQMLLQAGVPKADITFAGSDDPKKAGGTGYTFLKKHYEYMLKERCGVDPNSGLYHYLTGTRITDTTTDSYRCLSDTTGNNFLQIIMRRDTAHLTPPQLPSSPYVTNESNTSTLTIPSGNPSTLTAATTKKCIFLPKGSMVSIQALNGVRGQAIFYKTQNDNVYPENVESIY